uniref:DNA mismatch repair protein MutS n=1 Tax=Lygus hesperus TaxID=30085 RepID=A0A0A9Y0V5_LYGHE
MHWSTCISMRMAAKLIVDCMTSDRLKERSGVFQAANLQRRPCSRNGHTTIRRLQSLLLLLLLALELSGSLYRTRQLGLVVRRAAVEGLPGFDDSGLRSSWDRFGPPVDGLDSAPSCTRVSASFTDQRHLSCVR